MDALDLVPIYILEKLLPWGIYLNSFMMNKEILLLEATWSQIYSMYKGIFKSNVGKYSLDALN